MSTEPYPDVTGDESGLVPPQSGRAPEWPKKIRTLTASELDRLTIDSAGRFYWDGRLVSYEAPRPPAPDATSADASDRPAMDVIDRAVYELGEHDEHGAHGDDHKATESAEGADLPKPMVTLPRDRDELRAVDYELDGSGQTQDHADIEPVSRLHTITTSDRVSLSLSRWQSLGAIILVLGIVVGASGAAAYGWVVAHDWGCRVGMIKSYCPPPPPPPPARPPRADIPA